MLILALAKLTYFSFGKTDLLTLSLLYVSTTALSQFVHLAETGR